MQGRGQGKERLKQTEVRLLLMPNASGASRVVRPYRVQKLHEFIGAGGHRKSCEGNEGACHGYF